VSTRFVGRETARALLLKHWAPALRLARRLKLPVSPGTEPARWERLRNYEIEYELRRVFGRSFVISEWCPFDGIFTSWRNHAPPKVLEAEIARIETCPLEAKPDGCRVTPEGYVADRLIDMLRDALAKARKRAAKTKGGGK
jgi:hypothetical protein